jgi:hypothetical protein
MSTYAPVHMYQNTCTFTLFTYAHKHTGYHTHLLHDCPWPISGIYLLLADLADQWGDSQAGWTRTWDMWFDLAQFSCSRVFQPPPRVKRVGFTYNNVVTFTCMHLLYITGLMHV